MRPDQDGLYGGSALAPMKRRTSRASLASAAMISPVGSATGSSVTCTSNHAHILAVRPATSANGWNSPFTVTICWVRSQDRLVGGPAG